MLIPAGRWSRKAAICCSLRASERRERQSRKVSATIRSVPRAISEIRARRAKWSERKASSMSSSTIRPSAASCSQRPAPTTDAETYEFINELGSKKNNVVPIGPLHVTSDEPGHFRLFVDGENIIDADYRLFYVHRGMEKLAETRMGYNEVTFLSDRVCGICGFAHSTAYTTSVENGMGIVVPERAQMIRAILLEVERLHSHLLNLGLACHFVGFDSGFMQFFRVREASMKMAEILTGARKTYGLNLIGVSSYFVNIVIGVVIVAAICVTHYKKRKETDVGFV